MPAHLLHESLTRSLLEEMASGLYREGERFFSVRTIRRLWKVSDTTAVTSLKTLAAMGLIAPKDRSGYYLCEKFRQRALLYLRRNRHPALRPLQSLIQKRRSLANELGGNIAIILEMVPPSLVPRQRHEDIISSSKLRQALKAFETVGKKYGFHPVWVGYPSDLKEVPALETTLAQGNFKGALVYCRSNHRQMKVLLEPLLRRRLPTVAIFDDCSGLPVHSVNVNNVGVGYDAIMQLCRMGHRRIAVLIRQKPHKVYKERLRGALMAANEKGLQLEVIRIGSDTGWTERFLAPDRPTAAFAIERKFVTPLAAPFAEHGLTVPRDLSVIISSSRSVLPGFDQPADTMNMRMGSRVGRLAAEMLHRIQKGDPVEKCALVNVSYTVRGSVAPPPC